MKVGINWSGQRELPCVRELFKERNIDFVELLIDNFLTTDVTSIKNFLDGRPCAFHIMNSQFLHRHEDELEGMAKMINSLIEHLDPIYVSDHVGKFQHRGKAMPQMLEIDYSKDAEWVIDKLSFWSELLNRKLLLENYPSVISQPKTQVNFFKTMLSQTSCGLLFDISNAYIAEKNTGQNKEAWAGLLNKCKNFHIAGFEDGPQSQFLVDTHNQCIEREVIDYLEELAQSFQIDTISVERDSNFIAKEWILDIDIVRGTQHNG